MRIFSIELENFRMFEKQRVEFPSLFTVLIGENGSGKTTVLEAIAGLLEVGFVNEIQMRASGKRVTASNLVDAGGIRHVIDEFGNKERARSFSISAQFESEPNKVSRTSFFLEIKAFAPDILGKDSEISQFEYPSELIYFANSLINELQDKKDPILPVLDFFGTDRNLGEPGVEIEYVANESRIENGYFGAMKGKTGGAKRFLSWYKTFENEATKFPNRRFVREHLDCVKQAILSVLPNWTDLSFSFPEDDLIGTSVDENGVETRRLFRHLSDGYQSVVALVGTIAWRCIRLNPHLGKNAVTESPGIVLIDELDLHLHPNWQKRIVGDLKRTFPKIQFICTTHSPYILQSLRAEEVFDIDGLIDYNPNTLDLELVSEIMGVKSAYSLENQEMEDLSTDYLQKLEIALASGKHVGPAVNGELDEIEAKVGDPGVRAFLKMHRLKLKQLP